MNIKVIVFATFLLSGLYTVTGAHAEEQAPTPPPAETTAPAPPPAPPPAIAPAPAAQKFYLEVDQADLAALNAALNELPKRLADPLILKLNGQLQAQQPITKAKDEAEKVRKGKR